MDTGEHMATPTDAQFLTLAQWFSPAYPVGGFAYSHGLEWEIEAGRVTCKDTLSNWIETVLRYGAGHSDALFLAAAYHAENGDIANIDQSSRAFAASAERLKESDLQGAAFCQITSAIWASNLTALTYPVAVGHAAKLAGLPLGLTTQMFLKAMISNLVSVGMRLVPLGQTEGQTLIHALTPIATEIAQQTETGDLADLGSTAFLADIASMKHETQYSRVFRT